MPSERNDWWGPRFRRDGQEIEAAEVVRSHNEWVVENEQLRAALSECVDLLDDFESWHRSRCSPSCTMGDKAKVALAKARALLGER